MNGLFEFDANSGVLDSMFPLIKLITTYSIIYWYLTSINSALI